MAPTKRPTSVVYWGNADLKDCVERLALKRNRTVSNLIETLVIQEVENAIAGGEINA
jgi:hypothetical protein